MSGQTAAGRAFDEAARQGLPAFVSDADAVRSIARAIAAAAQRNEPAAHPTRTARADVFVSTGGRR